MNVFENYNGTQKLVPKTMRAGSTQPLLDFGQSENPLEKVNFNIDELEEM